MTTTERPAIQWPSWVMPETRKVLESVLAVVGAATVHATGGRDCRNVMLRELCRSLGLQDRNSVGWVADLMLERLNAR